MPRVLLAWEGGAGRGHIVTLKTIADALGAPALVDAALCRMEHADELAGSCATVFQGASLGYQPHARGARPAARAATWGDFLADLGFCDRDLLIRQIGWWRDTLVARRVGLVIGDYAPCALLAARSLGLAAVGVGTGYGLPPADLDQFPVLIDDYGARLYDEVEIVAAVNGALAHFDAAPIVRAPEIYAYDDQLVRTLPQLDPYPSRSDDYLPPVADVASAVGGGGDEVFIYFSTSELADAALMEAACTLDAPTRLFAPGATPAQRAALARHPQVIVETRPVPVDQIARRSRMMLHSAQHGILCLGLAAGLPQAAAPQHLEQEFHARRAQTAGVLRLLPRGGDAATLREAIRAVYHDADMARHARAMAQDARPRMLKDVARLIRARLDRVMARAGGQAR